MTDRRRSGLLWPVRDADSLWDMLEASDGELVVDTYPMFVGGKGWIRVVDGEVESRYALIDASGEGSVVAGSEPDEDFDTADFGALFDGSGPGPDPRVCLLHVDDTPFGENDDE